MRKLWIILPIGYLIVAIALITVFGGAGHGNGFELFYYVSAPTSFFVPESDYVVYTTLIVGSLQYLAIGWILGSWLAKGKK